MSTYRDHLRAIKLEQRFGKHACCSMCGMNEYAALVFHRGEILCYECLLRQQGKSPYEIHHVYGRMREEVMLLPANLHRIVTFYYLATDSLSFISTALVCELQTNRLRLEGASLFFCILLLCVVAILQQEEPTHG